MSIPFKYKSPLNIETNAVREALISSRTYFACPPVFSNPLLKRRIFPFNSLSHCNLTRDGSKDILSSMSSPYTRTYCFFIVRNSMGYESREEHTSAFVIKRGIATCRFRQRPTGPMALSRLPMASSERITRKLISDFPGI